MQEQLKQYSIIKKIPVQWVEMDVARHVNNVIYLNWSESARLTYFEKMGMDTSFASSEAGPILAWQDCKYIFPITYPDTAIVGMRVTEIKNDCVIMESAIFSEKHQRIAAISQQKVVPYNYVELKKMEVPESWRAGVKRLESRD